MRWFDRTFDVLNPNHSFSGILERLKGTSYRLRGMLDAIDNNFLRTRFDERWSIQENIGHLSDLEPLWLQRLNDLLDGKRDLTDADLANTRTHQAEHHIAATDDLVNNFMDQRILLVTVLAKMSEEERRATANHPRLGTPMRAADLAFFVAEHDDHHLARISQLCDTHNLWVG